MTPSRVVRSVAAVPRPPRGIPPTPPSLTRGWTRAALVLTLAASILPGGVALLGLVWLVSTGDGRSVLKWALVIAAGVVVWL